VEVWASEAKEEAQLRFITLAVVVRVRVARRSQKLELE
jgi:hypothetical protein